MRLVVYPIIHKVLYVPGGAGSPPSTVVFVEISQRLCTVFGVNDSEPGRDCGWGLVMVCPYKVLINCQDLAVFKSFHDCNYNTSQDMIYPKNPEPSYGNTRPS